MHKIRHRRKATRRCLSCVDCRIWVYCLEEIPKIGLRKVSQPHDDFVLRIRLLRNQGFGRASPNATHVPLCPETFHKSLDVSISYISTPKSEERKNYSYKHNDTNAISTPEDMKTRESLLFPRCSWSPVKRRPQSVLDHLLPPIPVLKSKTQMSIPPILQRPYQLIADIFRPRISLVSSLILSTGSSRLAI